MIPEKIKKIWYTTKEVSELTGIDKRAVIKMKPFYPRDIRCYGRRLKFWHEFVEKLKNNELQRT